MNCKLKPVGTIEKYLRLACTYLTDGVFNRRYNEFTTLLLFRKGICSYANHVTNQWIPQTDYNLSIAKLYEDSQKIFDEQTFKSKTAIVFWFFQEAFKRGISELPYVSLNEEMKNLVSLRRAQKISYEVLTPEYEELTIDFDLEDEDET